MNLSSAANSRLFRQPTINSMWLIQLKQTLHSFALEFRKSTACDSPHAASMSMSESTSILTAIYSAHSDLRTLRTHSRLSAISLRDFHIPTNGSFLILPRAPGLARPYRSLKNPTKSRTCLWYSPGSSSICLSSSFLSITVLPSWGTTPVSAADRLPIKYDFPCWEMKRWENVESTDLRYSCDSRRKARKSVWLKMSGFCGIGAYSRRFGGSKSICAA